MNGGRRHLAGLLIAALCAAVLAGCGVSSGSSGPSQADPASVTPASALLYVSLPARLGGAQGSAATHLIRELGGPSAENKLEASISKLLRKRNLSYSSNVKPWLGGHIAVVLTGFPSLTSLLGSGLGSGGLSGGAYGAGEAVARAAIGDFAVIAPTNNPSAAQSFLKTALSKLPSGITAVVHNRWVLIGGSSAVSAIEATSSSDSLAGSSAYSTMTSQAGGGQPASSLYIASGQFAHDVSPLLQAAAATGAVGTSGAAGLLNLYQKELARIPAGASALLTLNFGAHATRLDVVDNGYPARKVPTGNVGHLPGSAWLALDTGNFTLPAGLEQQLPNLLKLGAVANAAGSAALSPSVAPALQRFESIYRELLGALGPLSVSVSGTTEATLQAGATLDSADPTAAKQLLGMLFAQIKAKHPSQISGSPTHFTFTTNKGQKGSVTDSGGKLIGLIGYPSVSAFTSPSSTLGSNATYQSAVGQLPSGASPLMYLAFSPIAQLVENQSHSANKAQTVSKLQQLSYVIVGASPTDTRLVLGTK